MEANDPDSLPERWRESVRTAVGQRMERHEHLDAVAAALRELPRSLPWTGMDALERLEVPTLVVGSRDEADPLHPLATAEEYARLLPQCGAGGGGRGPDAARLAGRAALRGHRRLPQAARSILTPSSATPSGVTTSVRSTSAKPQAR